MIAAGDEIFSASPADDVAIGHAKRYIKLHDLTTEHVKLLKGSTNVTIVAKKDIELSNKTFDTVEPTSYKGAEGE